MSRLAAHVHAVILTVLLAACSDPHAKQAAEAARLLAADQAFAQASLDRGTADAFFANLSEDAIQLPANSAAIEGRDAIRDHLQPLGMHVLAWTPRKAEVAASLDLGWTWGDWRLLASARSGEVLGRGKYLNVWRRDASGHWKLAVDIGNEVEPPPPVAAPPTEASPDVAPDDAPPASPSASLRPS